MASSQAQKPLKHGGKSPVMGSTHLDLWECNGKCITQAMLMWKKEMRLGNPLRGAGELSEPGEAKWEANSST